MELEQIASGKNDRDKIADMLEALPLFNGFSRPEINSLAAYMNAYQVAKEVIIFQEGGKEDAMWFLVQGKVDIVKETDNEKRCRLTTVTAGKSIGEMSVIDGMPYSATGITATRSTLIRLTKKSFDSVCHEHPTLGIKVLQRIARLLSMRLRQTSGALVHLVGK